MNKKVKFYVLLSGGVTVFVLLLSFVFLSCVHHSQKIVTKIWTRQLGTADNDWGNGVAVDSSGNIYVTGETGGGLDGNISAGGMDIFLVKYDSLGNKLWTRQLGTADDDWGTGVAVDSSGNIYVTGDTYGGLDGNISAGEKDIFLVKYNSSGNKLWTRQLGTAYGDAGNGVAVDSSGNIYVTGNTWGGLDGNISAGNEDIFLVKYNSSGNKLWTRQLGTAYGDGGFGVAVDSSGNIYVTGGTGGGLDGNINAGESDIFLVKYDSLGNKLWTRQLGTANYDSGRGVAVDSSGNIYVTGETGGGFDENISAGNEDIFLVKYDSLGNKLWTRQLGTADSDAGRGVAVDSSRNIYVTGWTLGGLDGNIKISTGSPDIFFPDIFLVKHSLSGNKLWTRQLGTANDDGGSGVAVDGSGNIYVTGLTNGGLDGNISAGDKDIFLVKFAQNLPPKKRK